MGGDENIKEYNSIIKKIFDEDQIIDIYSYFKRNVDDDLISDGHHLTKKGSKVLAEQIFNMVNH